MSNAAKALPTRCDYCKGELKLTRSTRDAEKGGVWHLLECQNCQLPMVVYEPPRN